MGELYTRFVELKKQAEKDWFEDKIGIVKFEHNNQNYEIYFTRKRANKYSIIHCKNNTIEWEQFPILPRIIGRRYGEKRRNSEERASIQGLRLDFIAKI